MPILVFVLIRMAAAAHDPRFGCADLFTSGGVLRAQLLQSRHLSEVEAERTAIVNGVVRRRPHPWLRRFERHLWRANAARPVAVVARPTGGPLIYDGPVPVDPRDESILEIDVPDFGTFARVANGAWRWDAAPVTLDVGAIPKHRFMATFEPALRQMFATGELDRATMAASIVVRDLETQQPVLLTNEPALHFFDAADGTRLGSERGRRYRLDDGNFYELTDRGWISRPSAHLLGRVSATLAHDSFREFLQQFPAALNDLPFGLDLTRVYVERAIRDDSGKSYWLLVGDDDRLLFDAETGRFIVTKGNRALTNATFTLRNHERVGLNLSGRPGWKDLPTTGEFERALIQAKHSERQ